jgi:hypothetical protein
MPQIENTDMELIQRLYFAAKTAVRDAEESPEVSFYTAMILRN